MYNDKALILTQKSFSQLRRIKFRWVLILSCLPLFGVVAAFGVAPTNIQEPILVQKVVETIGIPKIDAQSQTKNVFWREEKIQKGDTIGSVLTRLQIKDEAAINFLRTGKDARSLYQLKTGKWLKARTNEDGDLLSLGYVNNSGNLFMIDKVGGEYKISERNPITETRVLMKSGEIKSSLFAATDAANLPDNIAIQLADIFSSDIDFYHDLRKGDRFSVIYETSYNAGDPLKTGRVLAAEFINQNKSYEAIYFENSDGKGEYFTREGKNLRKAFLRSPLTFSRISSGFSLARFHPVLRTWRAHRGIDYAAPTGTPVKATADGIVKVIGKQNGYGNVIILQHQGSYNTVYGHLSKFAANLRRSSKVSQGDIIGYVGMTGLVTGPHLHYEFRINGVERNPLKVALPTGLPVPVKDRGSFENIVDAMMQRLNLLRTTNLAKLD